MKFNIGDRVRVRQYKYLPEKVTNKGIGKSAGKDGEIVDIMYSNASDCYLYKIHFDGFDRPSHTEFPEGSFDLIADLDREVYSCDIEILDNVVVARMYEIRGKEKTEICKGHGHIIHNGEFGVAQAASYALKRLASKLNGGSIDGREKEVD